MEKLTKRITVYGRVQGVGFRPSVCRLANKYALQGYVRNLGGIVEIVVVGSEAAYQSFKQELLLMPEPASVQKIEELDVDDNEYLAQYELQAKAKDSLFFSVPSAGEAEQAVLPADIGVCSQCLSELQQPYGRRHNYPYISCAQCGPRYTIMERLPYDRENTSMRAFSMCSACTNEYYDMQDRRGHAETISCWNCGPQIFGLVKASPIALTKMPAIEAAKKLLLASKIIMVKAIGGYNLVCRADEASVVAKLRDLKQRPSKPLAVMCPDIMAVAKLCEVNEQEKTLLESAARPIVLLARKADCQQIAANVSQGTPCLGVFLPPMGFYAQLCDLGVPLVVTSCNYSGTPIIYKDEEAERFYQQIEQVAGLFSYDRKILRPADDAVVTDKQVLRRTKGYMPEPLLLDNFGCEQAVLAAGAQMEPGFCFSIGHKLYPAQIPGELEEEATENLWLRTVEDWQKLLNIKPKLVVGDLHPGYSSTMLGKKLADELQCEFWQLQHHHAHALAVMAEHQLQGKTLAVCFDGTGYGTDGTIWGGEFLLCEGAEYIRFSHLEAVPMLGGDASMKQAWKSACCYLSSWEKKNVSELASAGNEPDWQNTNIELQNFDARYNIVKAALAGNINVIANSSMGRMFDAVAAVLDIADYNSHQGLCAQSLEAVANLALDKKITPLELHFTKMADAQGGLVWSSVSLWSKLLSVRQHLLAADISAEEKQMAAALGFHQAVIELVVATAQQAYVENDIKQIALAGGCFANRILLEGCVAALEKLDFKVYYNHRVPPGDGGIALGQAFYGMVKLESNKIATK